MGFRSTVRYNIDIIRKRWWKSGQQFGTTKDNRTTVLYNYHNLTTSRLTSHVNFQFNSLRVRVQAECFTYQTMTSSRTTNSSVRNVDTAISTDDRQIIERPQYDDCRPSQSTFNDYFYQKSIQILPSTILLHAPFSNSLGNHTETAEETAETTRKPQKPLSK